MPPNRKVEDGIWRSSSESVRGYVVPREATMERYSDHDTYWLVVTSKSSTRAIYIFGELLKVLGHIELRGSRFYRFLPFGF